MELQPRNANYTGFLGEIAADPERRAPASRRRPRPSNCFAASLELQPGNPRARFYLATIKDLRGDHRGAVDDLIALLRDPPRSSRGRRSRCATPRR